MFFVYLLISSSDEKFCYVGLTNSLSKRLKQHRSGQFKPTDDFLPVDLVYYEAYNDKHLAQERLDYLQDETNLKELKHRLSLY